MHFHLGKPILVMLVLSLLSGGAALLRRTPKQADLSVWCFAESHQKSYRGDGTGIGGEPPAARFERRYGQRVNVELINLRAENVRLQTLFSMDGASALLPDLAEVEIGSVGQYFRPPVDHVGFLPLNDLLKQSGWEDQILKSRLDAWSKQGVVFGIPHDVHPTTITFRKDLFDQAGVDLAAAKTWPEFQQAALRFQRYWHDQGERRHAIGLSTTAADTLSVMLLQQHINLIDNQDVIHINDPRVAETLEFYAQLVSGPGRIGTDLNPAPGQAYRDIATGQICAMVTPDWQVGYMRIYAPDVGGKLYMMQLPRFRPDDAPTASWGGTMIGIPRHCKDPQRAWKLLEALYLEHDAIVYRRQQTSILPPIKKYWGDEVYHRPDPFFMHEQRGDELFIQLAEQMPPRYVTPLTSTAAILLADVLNVATARVEAGETRGLRQEIQRDLDQAADDLARRMKFGTFE